jgi:hypothetical protein
MKQGINLGRPPARSMRPVIALVVSAGVAALALALLHHRSRMEVDSLESEIARLSGPLIESSEAPSPDRERAAVRLRLALDSGTVNTASPTALLHLVESALPEGVVLGRLSFNASPQQSLTLDAVALGGDLVTELQRRLSTAPLVSSTGLLEERRLEDGRVAVRIQVRLEPR